MSTLRINNIEAQSVPASPTIDEKVKVTNSSGDILVNIDGKTSGITTIGINTTDGNIKFDANSNVLITGILTATTLAGNFTPDSLEIGSNIKLGNAGVITATNFKSGVTNVHNLGVTLTGGQLDVGSNIKLGTAGVVTATSFVGSGANLTGITQTTINSNTNNYLITGTGTANTLQGESGLTYDGDNLNLSAGAHDSGMTITAANNNQETKLNVKGKASDGTVHTVSLTAKRSSNRGGIEVGGSERLSITSDGKIGVNQTGPTSELQVGGGTNPMTAKPTFHVAPSSGNASMSLRGGSPSIYFDGTGGGHTRFLTDGTDIAISTGNLDSAGSERFRFRSSGGICFNGDTAAANALDDYEEGEYTANLRVTSGSATFDSGSGNKLYYTKIGDIVYINGGFSASSVSGAGGNLQVSLPFATKNSSAGVAKGAIGSIWNYYGSNNPYGNYGWYTLHGEGMNANVSNNITLAILGYNSQNSNWGPIGGLIGNNSQVHFSFTYRTN